jgi:hypothetical protein
MKRNVLMVLASLMVLGFVNFATPAAYAAPGDKCDATTPCPAGEICNASNVCEAAPAAPALKADASPCTMDAECQSGYCSPNSICEQKPATGSPVPAATAPAVDPCDSLPFSQNGDDYGCVVAAAVDFSMPGTPNGVKAKLGKMSPKALDAYKIRLEKLVRGYLWLLYDYEIDDRALIFDDTNPGYWSNETIAAYLKGWSTKLDNMGTGRSSLPHGGKK